MMAFPKFDIDAAIRRLRAAPVAERPVSSRSSESSGKERPKSNLSTRANRKSDQSNTINYRASPTGIGYEETVQNRESSTATLATTASQLDPETIAQVYGLTLTDLQQTAGPDWPEFKDNPALVKALARVIQTRRIRERGEIPPHYTATTICQHCGPVPIFPGAGRHVAGCVWCFRRVQGKSIPCVELLVTHNAPRP